MHELNPWKILHEITFLCQKIFGTGFPDALHSNVTVLPFLAVTCPFCGTDRNEGGTVRRQKKNNKSKFYVTVQCTKSIENTQFCKIK